MRIFSLTTVQKIIIGMLVVGGLVGVWQTVFVSPVLADVACGWECSGSVAVCKPGGMNGTRYALAIGAKTQRKYLSVFREGQK